MTKVEEIRRNGLRCSMSLGIPGLSILSPDGWSGIDVEFARACATALSGSAENIEWLPTHSDDRLRTVIEDRADLGVSNASWTFERDSHVAFVGVLCYDGEGFLTRRKNATLDELNESYVSVLDGTTTVSNMAALEDASGLSLRPVPCSSPAQALERYLRGFTEATVLDKLALGGILAKLPDKDNHVILTETISTEPLPPLSPGTISNCFCA